MHNHPSIPLDSESTQMFSHLLAASKHCGIGARQRAGQNRGSVWARGVGKSCARSREIYSKSTQPILSLICAAENTNHLPYITLPLTTHFIFRTNEFIIRRDLPLGASALSREGVMAQISHHHHYQHQQHHHHHKHHLASILQIVQEQQFVTV